MIRVLRRLRSFGDKIAFAVTATSGLAVVTVAVLLAIADYADLRRETLATVRSQAAMVSLNSGAALVFGDRVHGEETLAALRAVPEVAAAALFDREGGLFASYRRAGDPAPKVAVSSSFSMSMTITCSIAPGGSGDSPAGWPQPPP